jgi:hypothetical protein
MSIFNGLNDAIKTLARRQKSLSYIVSDFAPQTFEDMIRAYQDSKRLVIWSGASDKTIYGAPEMNYLFRAMHDLAHIQCMADFTLSGETRVALHQMSQVGTELAKIIRIEVISQIEFLNQYGNFPENQVNFTINQLKKGVTK